MNCPIVRSAQLCAGTFYGTVHARPLSTKTKYSLKKNVMNQNRREKKKRVRKEGQTGCKHPLA